MRWGLLAISTCVFTACSGETPEPVTDDPSVLEPPLPGEGFQLDQGRFTIEPGREALYCKRLPVPGRTEGQSEPIYVRGVRSRLPKFTHHYFMAFSPVEVMTEQACNGTEPLVYLDDPNNPPDEHGGVDGKMLFLAGEGRDEYFLPEGYALRIGTSSGHFSTSHHVVNTSLEPASMYGLFNLYTLPESEVRHPINILNCLQTEIRVPPHSEARFFGTCTAPFDLDLVILGSHAHQYLKRFEMKFFDGNETAAEPFYVSEDWDSPEIIPLETPIRLTRGQGITFSCLYQNNTDHEVTSGSGEFGEMCAIMSAYAYPPARPYEVPPPLGILVVEQGGTSELLDTTNFNLPF